MAIDTQDKRASVIAVAQPHLSAVRPNPDGAITSLADRQHLGFLYRGISVGGAPTFQIAWAMAANSAVISTG